MFVIGSCGWFKGMLGFAVGDDVPACFALSCVFYWLRWW